MGRRKKRRRSDPGDATPAPPKSPDRLNRPFAEALAKVRLPSPRPGPPSPPGQNRPPGARPPERTAPPAAKDAGAAPPAAPQHGYEDRVAFAQAFADVKPLAPRRARSGGAASAGSREAQGTPGARPATSADEQRARARLDALVGGGVRFRIERDDGWVEGLQEGHSASVLQAMRRRGWAPEAELDLHGLTVEEASRQVVQFLREGHRRGVRRVLLIHGRGAHSEGGVGVLGERVVHTLTEGRAAPLVLAFATAPRSMGGEGALVVQLASK